MLLQFSISNFKSFHTEVLLNLIPAKSRIHPDHILKSEEHGRKVKTLPIAVLYGANASGKSNLVKAISFARKLILEGTRAEKPINVTPFRLGTDSISKPSRFEFVLKHEGTLYTYGFSATEHTIHEEWLFAVVKQKEIRLFERITKDGRTVVEAGDTLATNQNEHERLKFVAEGTRPNQLFLTEAIERNVEALKPLWLWFRNYLIIINPDGKYQRLILRARGEDQFKLFLTDFLHLADTGIEGIQIKEKDFDLNHDLPSDISESSRKYALNGLTKTPEHSVFFHKAREFFALQQKADGGTKMLSMETQHRHEDGTLVNFNTSDESDGTHRMMHLAPALIDKPDAENTYIIDELDRSMHPLLTRLFIETFLREIKEEKSRNQMIVTTHETCLLDLDLLRRDEIWFVEKDKKSASQLTSLAEFKYQVRADLKVAKGYLNGRFGAIPFIGDIRQLLRRGR